MDAKIFRGSLDRWNDDKGFGFIRGKESKRDIFIHISAFKKNINRRPKVGDVIFYETHIENSGKIRAVNARIEGLAAKPVNITGDKSPIVHRDYRRKKSTRFHSRIFALLFVVGAGMAVYRYGPPKMGGSNYLNSMPKQAQQFKEEYHCQGKVYCSEMRSRHEAMFYLRNCPGTKMDGDHDGIPCESQFRW